MTSGRLLPCALALALMAAGVILLHAGTYGWTVFVVIPLLLGSLSFWAVRPVTGRGAAGAGMLTASGACVGLLLLGVEGLICIAMALPLAAPMGALGGWLAYRFARSPLGARGSAAMLLLLPPAGLWDTQAAPPVFAVRTALEVNAPPAAVWNHVIRFPDLPEPTEWFFRAGVAYPVRARLEGAGPGAIRYCEFSTGSFVEPIEVWDAPRLLRFRVNANPAPMREWSLYGGVSPPHLHGYMISRRGQFQLSPLPGNRTLLEGTTWYQHGLWPAAYWRWWSDAIIHRIHLRVLKHIRTLAEA